MPIQTPICDFGQKAHDFKLKSTDNKMISLEDLKGENNLQKAVMSWQDYKNSLLSYNLDLDYIETLIRERFLLGKKNETIYIIKSNDTKN